MHVEEFFLQDFEILVIQAEPSLEGTIGHTSLVFEEVNDLGKNVIEGHG